MIAKRRQYHSFKLLLTGLNQWNLFSGVNRYLATSLTLAIAMLVASTASASIVVSDPVERPKDLCLVGEMNEFQKDCGQNLCEQIAWSGTGVAESQRFYSEDGFGFVWTTDYLPTDEWDYFSIHTEEELFFVNSGNFYTAYDLRNDFQECRIEFVRFWKSCAPPPECTKLDCMPEPSSAAVWCLGLLGFFFRKRGLL